MAQIGAQFVNAVQPAPVGTIIHDWPGQNIPTGWISVDGQAISRNDYADLFSAIGTTYGVGDGSNTFNVPKKSIESDASGRVRMQYQPMVVGHSPQDATTGAATVRWGSLVQQVGNHYSTSTGVFTCPVSGRYWMYGHVLYNGGAPYLYAVLNGTGFIMSHENQTGAYPTITVAAVYNCAANDTLSFYFTANSATLYANAGHSGFSIVYLG